MTRHIIPLAAISFVSLLSAGALAQENAAGEVLTGDAAFGDWQEDGPGVKRHITPEDLEEPDLTASTSNPPEDAAMPPDATPQVPEGFKVEMVAEGIENPRVIRFAPNGDMFVANSEAGEVLVYRFAEGSAEPTEESVFAEKLNQPYGIAFYPPGENPEWVYIAESDGLKRFAYASGDLKASGDPEPEPEVLVEGIPGEHHWTRDIVFSADGQRLYYSVGSGSDVAEQVSEEPEGGWEAWAQEHALGAMWGEEEGRALVLSFDPEGEDEKVFATGLRNCSGMTIQPATGDLWCVVNERDGLGDNVPFDYATHVEEGAFYGWPWYYIGDHEEPRLAGQRPDLADQVTVPDVLFQAHSAPLTIAFSESSAWGAEYRGDAFVAMHGSWNRGTRTGYKVVRLDFDESGNTDGSYEDFMTGFVVDDAAAWGRPVGVAFAEDGSLFVSEDGSGTIWKVSKE